MGTDPLKKAAATAATSPPTVPIIRQGTIALSLVLRKVHVTAAEPTASNKKKSVRRTTPSSVIGWMSAPVTGVANVDWFKTGLLDGILVIYWRINWTQRSAKTARSRKASLLRLKSLIRG